MLSDNKNLEQVVRLIAKKHKLPGQSITFHTHLKNDLGIDSLEIVELLIDMERRFNLYVSPEQQFKIQTIGDLMEIIAPFQRN
jgi:acyl carrier protein